MTDIINIPPYLQFAYHFKQAKSVITVNSIAQIANVRLLRSLFAIFPNQNRLRPSKMLKVIRSYFFRISYILTKVAICLYSYYTPTHNRRLNPNPNNPKISKFVPPDFNYYRFLRNFIEFSDR